MEYLNAAIFNLEMDEIRVFAWDKRCLDSGKSRSQIFADDIQYYYRTIRAKQQEAKIMMWSDMVDPHHNAALYETDRVVEILADRGMNDLLMVPWDYTIAEKSLEFFAGKGFSVVASSQSRIKGNSVAPVWAYHLRKAYRESDALYGLLHAPWEYDYDTEEGMAGLRTAADYAWSVGPYIIHTPINTAPVGESIAVEALIRGDEIVFDGEKLKKGPLPVVAALVFYRVSGTERFSKIQMKKKGKSYHALIPAIAKTANDIEYYIEVSDAQHTSRAPHSAPLYPNKIALLQYDEALFKSKLRK